MYDLQVCLCLCRQRRIAKLHSFVYKTVYTNTYHL